MINMMTEGKCPHSEMAEARLTEGIEVVFEQDTQSSFASQRSGSSGSHSSVTGRRRRTRDTRRGRHRSSSSTSSSSSSSSRSRPRSRSHPRCHRPSSRCRCSGHRRYGSRYGRMRSPPRRYRAHSRSYSPSPDRSPRLSSHRSRSRSRSQRGSSRTFVGRYRCVFSRSPSSTVRSHRSQSRSSGRSTVSLTLDEKRELLRTAKTNAVKILGVEQLELPDSVRPILGEQTLNPRPATPDAEERVRPVSAAEKTPSQISEPVLDEDVPSPKTSPKRKIISFSIYNSVAKPTVVAPACAKVTPRVDSIESRKPYGHWVPVRRAGQTSHSRKHTLSTSH